VAAATYGVAVSELRIDIWSDIACPWCYVGKRRLEAALAQFEHRDQVKIHWRAFELDPSAPRVRDETEPYAARLARKYRVAPSQAQTMIDRMTRTAAEDGLDFHFERARSGNTFDAHRLVHLGEVRGVQDAVKERFLRAYLSEGHAIGLPEVLAPLAVEAGLDRDEVREVLAGDRYAAEVRGDERLAQELGISGVPFFVLDQRLGVSGAQPAEVLRGALAEAWSTRAPSSIETFAEGAACGPDGCD
jgi:predicted DsbA family dithiol-disulfide isomerase